MHSSSSSSPSSLNMTYQHQQHLLSRMSNNDNTAQLRPYSMSAAHNTMTPMSAFVSDDSICQSNDNINLDSGDSNIGEYHDYFDKDVSSIKQEIELPKGKRRGPRGGVVVPFPVKLYDMLEGVRKEGLEDVVSWLPHGRAFLVHKPSEFVNDIMPRYFRQSKLTSFQRQLNLYGFMRLSTGSERGAYWHELFLRGRSDLCKIMLRTRVKGNGMKPPPALTVEPNFYEYPTCSEQNLAMLPPPPKKAERLSSDIVKNLDPTPLRMMGRLDRRTTSANETLKQALDVFGCGDDIEDNPAPMKKQRYSENTSVYELPETTKPMMAMMPAPPSIMQQQQQQWRNGYPTSRRPTTPNVGSPSAATVSPMPVANVSQTDVTAIPLPDVSCGSSYSSNTSASSDSSLSLQPPQTMSSSHSAPATYQQEYAAQNYSNTSCVNEVTCSANDNSNATLRRISRDFEDFGPTFFDDAETAFFEGHKFACVDGASLEAFENNFMSKSNKTN